MESVVRGKTDGTALFHLEGCACDPFRRRRSPDGRRRRGNAERARRQRKTADQTIFLYSHSIRPPFKKRPWRYCPDLPSPTRNRKRRSGRPSNRRSIRQARGVHSCFSSFFQFLLKSTIGFFIYYNTRTTFPQW